MANICIQNDDFDQSTLYAALATGKQAGAVVTFVGRVRDFEASDRSMWLEHYPGMTQKVLQQIADRACRRWPLYDVCIVHRVGHLLPGEQIVFVGVSAAHRQDAFRACEYLIDCLKTEAPFWKREGERWVAAKASDEQAAQSWEQND